MKRIVFPVAVFLATLLCGCLKDPDYEALSSNFVVATNADTEADFASYQTYYISDSVAYISTSSTDTILNNSSSQMLVDAIKQNLKKNLWVITMLL